MRKKQKIENFIFPGKMETQKIIIPNYLSDKEEEEFKKELRELDCFYTQIIFYHRMFNRFKIPFPENLHERFKPDLKHITDFPMNLPQDELFDFEQERKFLVNFYSEAREIKQFCEEMKIQLPENFSGRNDRCVKWKYFQLKE